MDSEGLYQRKYLGFMTCCRLPTHCWPLPFRMHVFVVWLRTLCVRMALRAEVYILELVFILSRENACMSTLSTYVSLHTYIHTYICVHTSTHTHTHTHTHTAADTHRHSFSQGFPENHTNYCAAHDSSIHNCLHDHTPDIGTG